LNQDAYRKLVSGESGGPGAVLLRFILGIAAHVYRVIIGLRNFLYSKGWLKIHRANAAVISIGNITTGGTGKTPLVIRLCKQIISDSKFSVCDSDSRLQGR
jgi:tetraacyldisaccharide 4'-kinase